MASRFVAVCLALHLSGGVLRAEALPPELLEAFQKRQSQTGNFQTRLVCTRSIANGRLGGDWQIDSTLSDGIPSEEGQSDGDRSGSDQADPWESTLEIRLSVEDDRYRLQLDGLVPNFSTRRFEQTSEVYASNGKDHRWLKWLAPDYHFPAQGVVLASGTALDRLDLQPLLWSLGSMKNEVEIGPNWSRLKVLRREELEGTPCLVLGEGDYQREWWIDPARGYAIIRHRQWRMESQTVRADLRVDLEPHPTLGWVPKSWIITRYGRSETPRWEILVEVAELALNIELPENTFELEFPPGTLVSDSRGSGGEPFVVRESGQPLPSVSEVPKAKKKTSSPSVPVATQSSLIPLSVAVAAVLLGIVLRLYGAWRYRRQESPL